jgi:hypothetical protein
MGVTERKFMVLFEEAMRRARKQARDYERFEWQLQEAFIAITETKRSLGVWTDEEIVMNKLTIVKNIKSLSNGDIELLRKLYDQDNSMFMGNENPGYTGVELRNATPDVSGREASGWKTKGCLNRFFSKNFGPVPGGYVQSQWLENDATDECRDLEEDGDTEIAEERSLFFLEKVTCDPRTLCFQGILPRGGHCVPGEPFSGR